MKHKLHIAYMNGEDMAREAVESVRAIGNIHLWPNNGAAPLDITGVEQHVLPDMSPISVINTMIQASWDDDVMFWMHNDGEAYPNIADAFLKATEQAFLSDARWGVYFTCYDILCAFNMKAVREIGYWDPMFFQYTADVDYYYRMKRAGWMTYEFGQTTVLHKGSMTIRRDKLFNHRTKWRERTAFDKLYYREKWGGPPGRETYATPFEHVPRT